MINVKNKRERFVEIVHPIKNDKDKFIGAVFTIKETENYKDWFEWGYFKSYFKLQFNCWGYFDPRPQVSSNVTSVLVILTFQ